MDSFLFYIPFKGKERPEQTKLFPANSAQTNTARSVSLHRVGLHAKLDTFGSLENKFSTLRSVSQFWIFEKYSNFFRNIIIWTLNSLEMKIFENLKNLFGLTPRSVSLRKV